MDDNRTPEDCINYLADKCAELEQKVKDLEDELFFYRGDNDKKQPEKEESLGYKVSKLNPKNGDVICISGPDVGPEEAREVKRMLIAAGVSRCHIYCMPGGVTLQEFGPENVAVFDAMIHAKCCGGH